MVRGRDPTMIAGMGMHRTEGIKVGISTEDSLSSHDEVDLEVWEEEVTKITRMEEGDFEDHSRCTTRLRTFLRFLLYRMRLGFQTLTQAILCRLCWLYNQWDFHYQGCLNLRCLLQAHSSSTMGDQEVDVGIMMPQAIAVEERVVTMSTAINQRQHGHRHLKTTSIIRSQVSFPVTTNHVLQYQIFNCEEA